MRNIIYWQDSNLEPTAWASNSGEEKDNLDHSATGQCIKPKDSVLSGPHMKILKRFESATFTSAVWYANHSATKTLYNRK